MTGSLILNRIVSAKFDKEQKSSDIEKAARMIIDAMNANQRELPRLFKDNNENLVSTLSKDETVKVIRQDVEQLKDDLEEIKGLSQELRDIAKGLSGINQEIKKTLANVSTSNSSIAEELPRLKAVAVTATASISALDNNVNDIEAAVSTINTNVADMTERLETDMEEIKSGAIYYTPVVYSGKNIGAIEGSYIRIDYKGYCDMYAGITMYWNGYVKMEVSLADDGTIYFKKIDDDFDHDEDIPWYLKWLSLVVMAITEIVVAIISDDLIDKIADQGASISADGINTVEWFGETEKVNNAYLNESLILQYN